MSVEQYILDTLNNIGTINFDGVMKIVALLFVVFWVFVVIWVWNDSGERSRNLFFRLTSVLTVLILNIFGLVIYLLIRPQFTIEEVYWSDLERRYLKYETKELGDCPKCGYQLQPGYIYCPECNYELKVKCKGCELYFDKDNKYCPYCGLINKKEIPLEQISAKEMQEIASANKDEIVQTVEEKGTRYSSKKGVFFKSADFFNKIFHTKTPEEKAEEKRLKEEKKAQEQRIKKEKRIEAENLKKAKLEAKKNNDKAVSESAEKKDQGSNQKKDKKVANKNNKKSNTK
ncbi:MAG TPA: zinc ribbon domain-containing protein [Candidatus Dojkabacteria bacterium]|nr:zinc ribbon domain-containing protein [Candidatus Dojkabacteria bacterium]HQG57439.1 zinc ribbon domain-containing protein [Candidatus Dojkabacteria bacterium]